MLMRHLDVDAAGRSSRLARDENRIYQCDLSPPMQRTIARPERAEEAETKIERRKTENQTQRKIDFAAKTRRRIR